ncbi:hypothetical protein CSE16_05620 [Solibacillus sp. R5-41]|uniref:hypothetical protein n=1 Tax=Solibacillus sp. R5-41 TaxID=2048654 RepID=UPI000C126FA6|nr:hypothetical protein [Solibacillus sp. R5-41]ATP39571.1 hypothetical protein CSE16_05620 [Solibacillus sp. R5-41]
MRKMIYVQYATMIVLSFISGVACYQLFDIQQVTQIIEWGDRRLLSVDKPTFIWSIIPFLLAIITVLLFSTHKFLTMIAPIIIAIKVTFLGFSSVFLLVQHHSIKLYALWWFPFQFLYCLLLIALYKSGQINRSGRPIRGAVPWKKVVAVLILMNVVFIGENFVISYLFK